MFVAKFVSTLIQDRNIALYGYTFSSYHFNYNNPKIKKEPELYRFNLLYITCMLRQGEMHFEFNTAETGESRK